MHRFLEQTNDLHCLLFHHLVFLGLCYILHFCQRHLNQNDRSFNRCHFVALRIVSSENHFSAQPVFRLWLNSIYLLNKRTDRPLTIHWHAWNTCRDTLKYTCISNTKRSVTHIIIFKKKTIVKNRLIRQFSRQNEWLAYKLRTSVSTCVRPNMKGYEHAAWSGLTSSRALPLPVRLWCCS